MAAAVVRPVGVNGQHGIHEVAMRVTEYNARQRMTCKTLFFGLLLLSLSAAFSYAAPPETAVGWALRTPGEGDCQHLRAGHGDLNDSQPVGHSQRRDSCDTTRDRSTTAVRWHPDSQRRECSHHHRHYSFGKPGGLALGRRSDAGQRHENCARTGGRAAARWRQHRAVRA